MLKLMVERQIIVMALGVFAGAGILSKCLVNATLARLVRASGNMSKSTHPLMRLMRAKFEHACMVSETVENVEVFVDKYLYGYKVFGIRLHSIRRMEKASALMCIVTGLFGAFSTYSVYGMNDLVLQMGAIGAGLGILVYVFHLTTDEDYRMKMARNYMVDYLQNVCLRRYERAYQRELEEKMHKAQMDEAQREEDEFEEAGIEAVSDEVDMLPDTDTLLEEYTTSTVQDMRIVSAAQDTHAMAEPTEAPTQSEDAEMTVASELGGNGRVQGTTKLHAVSEFPASEPENRVSRQSFEEKKEALEGTEQKYVEKEIRIRQILEEFMA